MKTGDGGGGRERMQMTGGEGRKQRIESLMKTEEGHRVGERVRRDGGNLLVGQMKSLDRGMQDTDVTMVTRNLALWGTRLFRRGNLTLHEWNNLDVTMTMRRHLLFSDLRGVSLGRCGR